MTLPAWRQLFLPPGGEAHWLHPYCIALKSTFNIALMDYQKREDAVLFCSLAEALTAKKPMERTVTLASKSGLHARPAAVFAQRAKEFQSQITLFKNGKTANGKSILSILALGAEQGQQVTLRTEGDDAQLALDKLTSLLEEDLG